jgi:hypothetical protein
MTINGAIASGYRGLVRYTYQTESNILCLKLVTDGTTSFKGFNATYTKFYNGTDIKGVGGFNQLCTYYMRSNDSLVGGLPWQTIGVLRSICNKASYGSANDNFVCEFVLNSLTWGPSLGSHYRA